MSTNTAIEWTHLPGYHAGASWNPVRGCVWASPGCDGCYARAFAERWRGIPGHPYEQGFDLRLVPENLDKPLHWQEPRGIFTNSMSDLFQRGVPDEFAETAIAVMAAARRHVFMNLTKRAARMRRFFERARGLEDLEATVFRIAGEHKRWIKWDARAPRLGWPRGTRPVDVAHLYNRRMTAKDLRDRLPWIWPLPNAWWGVSVEDRRHGIPRVAQLRKVPAAVRFLSVEPLLEDVSADLDLDGIGWVIVGGESDQPGHEARPFDLDWAYAIVQRCRAAGVPVFVKQIGDAPRRGGELIQIRGRKGGGDARPEDLRISEFPLVLGRAA